MFGSHLSISGGLEKALLSAIDLKLDCLQIFNANQRQWNAKDLTNENIQTWEIFKKKLPWYQDSFNRIVCHNSYLVNMASPNNETRNKSINRQMLELNRCEQLGIQYLVTHPGAHLGSSKKGTHDLEKKPTKDELNGLLRIVESINEIHRSLKGLCVKICLETTVGSGTNLGYAFHHLRFIKENVSEPERIVFCIDTCHITAAGYDLSTEQKANETLSLWNTVCGDKNIGVFHFNDSVGKIGSRKDRHAHIGEGNCGIHCFKTIINTKKYNTIPKILETPKGTNSDGVEFDTINIKNLLRLKK